MGSCNSTEIETSNSKLKSNLKKNKNLFQSKKLRNLKENIDSKEGALFSDIFIMVEAIDDLKKLE